MTRQNKEQRLHFRVTTHQKNIIGRAAELTGVTMTDFILKAAYQAAAELIVEQTERKVTPGSWAIIEAALDSPPKEIAALQEMVKKYGQVLQPASGIDSPQLSQAAFQSEGLLKNPAAAVQATSPYSEACLPYLRQGDAASSCTSVSSATIVKSVAAAA